MQGELSSEAVAETLDPQIELHWHDQRTYRDTPQHLRGVPEVIEFTEQYRSAWEEPGPGAKSHGRRQQHGCRRDVAALGWSRDGARI